MQFPDSVKIGSLVRISGSCCFADSSEELSAGCFSTNFVTNGNFGIIIDESTIKSGWHPRAFRVLTPKGCGWFWDGVWDVIEK